MMGRNLPPPIHKWWYIRIFGLFIIAVYSIRFGVMYTPIITSNTRVPQALNAITAVVPGPSDGWQPVWALGFIWIGLGLAALAAIAWPRIHNAVFIATAAFTAYWTLAYAFAPLTDNYQVPPPPGAPSVSQDAYTAIFYGVACLFVIYVGLTSRPAIPSDDEPELPDYGDYEVGEHRV